MGVWLHIPDFEPARCTTFRSHLTLPLTRGRGPGDPRIAGRAAHEALTITKRLDAVSPFIHAWCAEGRRLDRVQVEVRRPPPGDPPPEPERDQEAPWFSITLSGVFAVSVLASMEDGPLETVALDYSAVRWSWDGDGADHRDAEVYR